MRVSPWRGASSHRLVDSAFSANEASGQRSRDRPAIELVSRALRNARVAEGRGFTRLASRAINAGLDSGLKELRKAAGPRESLNGERKQHNRARA